MCSTPRTQPSKSGFHSLLGGVHNNINGFISQPNLLAHLQLDHIERHEEAPAEAGPGLAVAPAVAVLPHTVIQGQEPETGRVLGSRTLSTLHLGCNRSNFLMSDFLHEPNWRKKVLP